MLKLKKIFNSQKIALEKLKLVLKETWLNKN